MSEPEPETFSKRERTKAKNRAIILDESDEVNSALAAGTPQSIGIAVEGVTPDLKKAVAKTE